MDCSDGFSSHAGTLPPSPVRSMRPAAVRFFFSQSRLQLRVSIVSIHRFCPSSLTRWTRQNRRWIGLSFAASHFIHLALILTISLCFPEPFLSEQSMGQWVFGGVGYLFVFLMAITSTDKSQRWMGMKHWRRLHVIGSYWLWTVFLLTYIKHAKEGGEWFFVPLLIFTTALLPIRLAKNLLVKPSLQLA